MLFHFTCESPCAAGMWLVRGPFRDLWELHHTFEVTDIPSGMLLASRLPTNMIQLWAEFDVAGVGLALNI